MNHDVFMTPGVEEEWTISVAHSEEDLRSSPTRSRRSPRHHGELAGEPMAGGPAVRLYRAEWSTNCERVGLALAYKGIEAQSVLIEYSNRGPVEAISGQAAGPGDRGRRPR